MKDFDLKQRATDLRKSGKTYTEILAVIPVAKSTLSLWLRDIDLSKHVEQLFTEKRKNASILGGQARKEQRIEKKRKIISKAEGEIKNLSKRDLWLIGIALYWAEGSKEKEHSVGRPTVFTNSDPYMIKIFLKWINQICHISSDRIHFELYIHDNHRNEVFRFKKYWSKVTGYPVECFNHVYFKKANLATKRRNKGDLYNGLVRVKVLRSSDLIRQIQGWTNGIIKSLI
jgi:hypothetical protein